MDELRGLFGAEEAGGPDLDGVLCAVGQELLHYARALTGSAEQAEDAVQDTLVALLEAGAAAREIESPRAWLFTVLRRQAFKYRTRRAPEAALAERVARGIESDPATRMMLREALAPLDDQTLEIVLLHDWEGLSFSEVAAALGLPRGTALSLYHRGMAKVRQRLGVESARAGQAGEGTHEPVAGTLPGA